MKKPFALLIASTALTVAIGVPAQAFAQSAMRVFGDTYGQTIATVFDDAQEALPLILVSGDDDEDEEDDEHEYRNAARHDDDDDDCGDDDDDFCSGNARNPAPAGTLTPPQNGLFGNGTPPQAQVN